MRKAVYCVDTPQTYTFVQTGRPELFTSAPSQRQVKSLKRKRQESTLTPETNDSKELVKKCQEFVTIEREFSEAWANELNSMQNHPFLDLEDSTMKLFTLENCVDQGLYCSFFLLKCDTLILRYMDAGSLKGFTEKVNEQQNHKH